MDPNPPRFNPAVVRDRTMANTFYDRLQEQISAGLAQLAEGEQLTVYHQGQSGSPMQRWQPHGRLDTSWKPSRTPRQRRLDDAYERAHSGH
jgi:hypothetical protein